MTAAIVGLISVLLAILFNVSMVHSVLDTILLPVVDLSKIEDALNEVISGIGEIFHGFREFFGQFGE